MIHVPTGKFAGLALVLDPGLPPVSRNGRVGARHPDFQDGPRPVVLTAERQVKRLAMIDFPYPVAAVDRLRIPKSFNPRSPQSRRDLASALRTKAGHLEPERFRRGRAAAADDPEITRLRTELRQHPCHGCDEREDHARWAERYHRLHRDTELLERRMRSRTHTIARTFDRVCGLLTDLGYLSGDTVTDDGKRLGRLYGELDLLASECIREGVWSGLDAAELAACASALVFEARQSDDATAPGCRRARPRRRWARWSGSGATWTPWRSSTGSTPPRASASASPTWASPGPPTAGRSATAWTRCCATPTCRPATSSAGPSS